MSETKEKEVPTIIRISNRYVLADKTEKPVTETEEILGVAKFETQPAMVHRGYGITLNLGNYESARVDVSITLPCYVEDVENADKFATKWVEERIMAEIAQVRSDQKKSKGGARF